MSLRINQNVTAFSAHRFMSTNDANMSKSIERLSSGLRINSAADDAAGLVISEQLRTQVSGLTQATRNTQDGINMVKTAESALNEVEVQLRNIRDLTLHASNATTTDDMKVADQAQVAQALASIDRIADQTQFAGKSLLGADGSNVNGSSFQIGANDGETATFSVGANAADMHANTTDGLGLNVGTAKFATADLTLGAAANNATTQTLSIKYTGADGTEYDYGTVTLAAAQTDTAAHAAAAIQSALTSNRPAAQGAPSLTATNTVGNTVEITLNASSDAAEKSVNAKITVTQTAKTAAAGEGMLVSAGTNFTTNVGAEYKGDAGAIDLTASTTGVLNAVDAALEKVNNLRVNLGAFQKNTLESNLNSLAVAKENTAASESAIRDTDMADEMVNFTKNQILTQAAQAMLTQANQAPQSILQMLR